MDQKQGNNPAPSTGLDLNFEGETKNIKKAVKRRKGCLKPFLIILIAALLLLFAGSFCFYV